MTATLTITELGTGTYIVCCCGDVLAYNSNIYTYRYRYSERWTPLVTTILNVFCGPIPFVTSLKAKSSKEKREETIEFTWFTSKELAYMKLFTSITSIKIERTVAKITKAIS